VVVAKQFQDARLADVATDVVGTTALIPPTEIASR
jgi:hypothetical protein